MGGHLRLLLDINSTLSMVLFGEYAFCMFPFLSSVFSFNFIRLLTLYRYLSGRISYFNKVIK
jgi:hypothetical protein